jgi:hypothetical protein
LLQTSAASRLRSASTAPPPVQQAQQAAAPANDVMTDLASSIMRRRASIEPQEEDEEDGDGLDARQSRVLGLRAYLASKDSGRSAADAQDDWE